MKKRKNQRTSTSRCVHVAIANDDGGKSSLTSTIDKIRAESEAMAKAKELEMRGMYNLCIWGGTSHILQSLLVKCAYPSRKAL